MEKGAVRQPGIYARRSVVTVIITPDQPNCDAFSSRLHRVLVLRMSTLSFYLINLLFSFFPLCGAWNSLEFLWYLRRCIETPSANMQRCWHLKHIMCYRSFSMWCVYYHCVFFVTSWYFPLLLPALCALLCREIHWTEGSDHRPLLTWDKMRFFFNLLGLLTLTLTVKSEKGRFPSICPLFPFPGRPQEAQIKCISLTS